jgi:kynurenine formamidase
MTETTTDNTATAGNWGRWGAEDERGALNLLTDDRVLSAAKACRTGKVYPLGLPVQPEGVPLFDFRGGPRRYTLTSPSDRRLQQYGAAEGLGAIEDVLVLPSHGITHIDALCHVFAEKTHYNGFPADDFETMSGAPRLGIENMAGFAGRAILADLPGHRGIDYLPLGEVVTGDELESCFEAQGVEVRSGDILLVRTGWIDYFRGLPQGADVPFEQPGLGYEAVEFVRSHDIAAVGADNGAIECMPFDRGVFMGVHVELLVRLGVPLMEHLDLAGLAQDRCYESLLVVAPLSVTGAAGSPINPIAIG